MNPALAAPSARRFRGLLLLALFFVGSAGVPLADATLFHLAGGDPLAGVAHLEGVGADHHADDCLLGVATAASTGASLTVAAVRAALPFKASPGHPPASFHADGVDPGAARPRAPPIA